jgi:hypothetical protein
MLIHSAVITGSVQLNNTDVSAITNVAGFATTSSVNSLVVRTGSYATTGSNQFNGNQSISGSITSNGTITAQTLVVQTVTSSIEFVTGSTRNGSLAANTHQFTGSVYMSGSVGIGANPPALNYRTHISTTGSNVFLGISNQGTATGDRQLRLGFGGAGADTFASIQGTRLNIADDVFVAVQSGGGQVGIGATSIKSLLGSNTKLTVAGSGGSGFGFAGGSIGSAAGSGTGALNLGISINGLDGGMTLLFLASRNTAGGTSTASAVYIISFYYSDENFPVITYLGGTSNFVSFGSSGTSLTATNSLGGNNLYSWFANK